jgi:putative transcription factor
MNHQDWNPVVIHGAKHNVSRPTQPHREVTKEQKLDREELGTHKKVSLSMANMIQQGRIAKGFKTQKDIAIAVVQLYSRLV